MISKYLSVYWGRSALFAAVAVALAGCGSYDSITQRIAQRITPYRITVVQGNFVSREAVAQMRAGMSRAQVRQVLGTPLLTDMFHADRWDYVFYFKRGSTSIVQQRDFVVNFSGDVVTSWSGGEDLPSNLELLAEIDGDKSGKKSALAGGATANPAPVPEPTVPDVARSPADDAAGVTTLPVTDANAQAAQAANRLTNAVQAPARNTTPSVRSNTPASNGGVPQGSASPSQPQFQFHRSTPPVVQDNSSAPPVGPTGE
ncbi:outer membrane protein assembly factor BamE [Paraburkholderia bonniea]|uniref:outer membrane protein assembly factor BamE n=1 Tax=Paraburkholderia bonniea TaxID=2152891 RepID=UPI0012922F4A|nr:outer membrane protein assembly factor BamE [Paraburkholderia bonniea]WJF89870.1 outer membrane protein assembly factor BamE [Paraburkholderia bonniea]WJF93184.1 outer membrane protein assembly factor BamE [Paraburkholderia bonniea]